jgi:hypothetical protein
MVVEVFVADVVFNGCSLDVFDVIVVVVFAGIFGIAVLLVGK